MLLFVILTDVEEVLLRYILKDYNPLLRPVKDIDDNITLQLGISLHAINGIVEMDEIVKINLWLDMTWKDQYVHWDPEQFGGLLSIRVPRGTVWSPDIMLINNADGHYDVSYGANTILFHDGTMQWIPPTLYKFSCHLDVRYFPFDEHVCEMRFASSAYDAKQLVYGYYLSRRQADVSEFSPSGSWDVLACPVHVRISNDGDRSEFICEIKVRRKSLFYIIYLLIPFALISFITVIMFYLPLDTKERITLGFSNLLSINVFLLLVSKILPPASNLPLISQYFLLVFMLNVIGIFATVVNLNLKHRTSRTYKMKGIWRRIILFKLPRLLFMDPMKPPQQNKYQQVCLKGRQEARLRRERSFSILTTAGTQAARAVESAEKECQKCGKSNTLLAKLASIFHDVSEFEWLINHYKEHAKNGEINDEWRFAAYVMDRLFLYIFLIATAVGTLSIAFITPDLFRSISQRTILDRLIAELNKNISNSKSVQ